MWVPNKQEESTTYHSNNAFARDRLETAVNREELPEAFTYLQILVCQVFNPNQVTPLWKENNKKSSNYNKQISNRQTQWMTYVMVLGFIRELQVKKIQQM